MRVDLLEHTPHPERAIATAARICYAPIGAEELFESLEEGEVHRMIRLVVGSGHLSAVEHASFTFAIEGISRVCSHQLVRHRLASYNQQSQRYVKYDKGLPFITPPSIERVPEAKAKFEKLCQDSVDLYQEFRELGIEAEDARFIFPHASETKLVMTMNARELLHFFSLRCCDRAQWEIRAMAMRMLKQLQKIAPVLFENAGPCCVRQPCTEGKFYCGKPWIKGNEAPSSDSE